jgi:hypothetical protein
MRRKVDQGKVHPLDLMETTQQFRNIYADGILFIPAGS